MSVFRTDCVRPTDAGALPRRHCLSDQWRDNGDPRDIWGERKMGAGHGR